MQTFLDIIEAIQVSREVIDERVRVANVLKSALSVAEDESYCEYRYSMKNSV